MDHICFLLVCLRCTIGKGPAGAGVQSIGTRLGAPHEKAL
jgi:hypothetical protein